MQAQGVLFGQIAVVFSIVIAGVWSATQWTAAALAYQRLCCTNLSVKAFSAI